MPKNDKKLVQDSLLNILMTAQLRGEVRKYAKKTNLSMSRFVRAAIRCYITQLKKDGFPPIPKSLYR